MLKLFQECEVVYTFLHQYIENPELLHTPIFCYLAENMTDVDLNKIKIKKIHIKAKTD